MTAIDVAAAGEEQLRVDRRFGSEVLVGLQGHPPPDDLSIQTVINVSSKSSWTEKSRCGGGWTRTSGRAIMSPPAL